MQKTFLITAECAESDGLYVICREDQLEGFLEECGFGCSECLSNQEVSMMSMDEVDYFVTDNGSVFSRDTWKMPIKPNK